MIVDKAFQFRVADAFTQALLHASNMMICSIQIGAG